MGKDVSKEIAGDKDLWMLRTRMVHFKYLGERTKENKTYILSIKLNII